MRALEAVALGNMSVWYVPQNNGTAIMDAVMFIAGSTWLAESASREWYDRATHSSRSPYARSQTPQRVCCPPRFILHAESQLGDRSTFPRVLRSAARVAR